MSCSLFKFRELQLNEYMISYDGYHFVELLIKLQISKLFDYFTNHTIIFYIYELIKDLNITKNKNN